MDQPVLMHADIDEGTEGGDIRHGAFQRHAGFQVGDLVHAIGKAGRDETGARIASGLFQFRQDVADRGQAEMRIDELLGPDRFQGLRLAHDRANVAPAGSDDLAGDAISLGVDGRGVQRLVPFADAQEARALFKGARPETRDLLQPRARAEGTLGIAMGDDVLRQGRTQPRDMGQQRRRGGVQIDADRVHGILDHCLERLGKLALVHVMLILPDADAFRRHLDQFRQRILQAARDRDGPAQGDVEIGKFLRGQFRCRIDRGPGFRHDHLGRRGHALGQAFQHIGHQTLGLAAGGAVADCDQIDPVPGDQGQQGGLGPAQIVLGLEWVDRRRLDHFAGPVHDRHLHAGTDAGIQTDGRARPRRCSQQQILEIASEDADRLVMGAFAQFGQQVDIHRVRQPDAPCPACHLPQPLIARLIAQTPDGLRHDPLGAGRAGFGVGGDVDGDDFLFRGAQDRQCAMRGDVRPFFAVVEIIAELGPGLFLARDHFGADESLGPHEFAQTAQQRGVFGQFLDENVARAVQCGFLVGHGFGDIARGQFLGIGGAVILDRPQQRLQPVFAGDHRLGASFGLEGQIDVFQCRFRLCPGDGARQIVGQFILIADRGQDRGAPRLHLAQIGQTF